MSSSSTSMSSARAVEDSNARTAVMQIVFMRGGLTSPAKGSVARAMTRDCTSTQPALPAAIFEQRTQRGLQHRALRRGLAVVAVEHQVHRDPRGNAFCIEVELRR